MHRLVATLSFLLATQLATAQDKTIGTFMCPRPELERQEGFGRFFPVDIIVGDFAEMGGTDMFFDHQWCYGGPFRHKTRVKGAAACHYMRGRDYLAETLTEAAKYGVNVWLVWSPPIRGERRAGRPGWKDSFYSLERIGLNSPEVRRIYRDVIDEIGRDYAPKHKNLAGIFWHEVHCSETSNSHADDLDEFCAFCQREFGEQYAGEAMPKADATDKWWRRSFLYRIDVLTSFIGEMADQARKHGLKTAFCHYPAETSVGWRMGVDAVKLERICDHLWEANWGGGRAYHSMRGVWLDFGPTYRNNNLARNFVHAFHGLPLSYFEFATPVYVKQIQAFFRSKRMKGWRDKYGDFYFDHGGKTQKELDIFLGKKNLGNWMQLMTSWCPGRTPAQVAVAIHPTPFIMMRPTDHGVTYTNEVRGLMEALAGRIDVDAFVTGSLRMDENLRTYELVILPEGMATGFDEKTLSQYRDYVRGGGKLLVVNTRVTTAKQDLTQMADVTPELCGVEVVAKNLPGYITIASDTAGLATAGKKVWAKTSKLQLRGAEVLAKDNATDQPLLTRYSLGKGQVIFSGVGFNQELEPWFTTIVNLLVSPALLLQGGGDLRIIEAVRKDGALGVSLWGQGSGTVCVDAAKLGLEGAEFTARDIVTGTVVARGLSPDALSKGFPVRIAYPNQPFVLAIGTDARMAQYAGIYPSADVFQGLRTRKALTENPQIPITVPDDEGVKVAVYHRGVGAGAIFEALSDAKLRAFSLPRLDTEALTHPDVLIVPQLFTTSFFDDAKDRLRKFVARGGGIMLLHDAVGYRRHKPLFPEIGKGKTHPKLSTAVVSKAHPITAGFKQGESFVHAFQYDHVAVEPGKAGEAILTDAESNAVLVAGRFGKGKVILNGMLTGHAGSKIAAGGDGPKPPEGPELRLLLNAVNWLAASEPEAPPRDKEAGVLDYRTFDFKKAKLYHKAFTQPLFAAVEKTGLKPEWVTPDIFRGAHKGQRDRYKRILIAWGSHWFSREMYDGMEDYVKNGGLLITNVVLAGVDDDGKRSWINRPGSPLIGVFGHSGVHVAKIKVESECPLTNGLPAGKWTPLDVKVTSRMARGYGATVLATSDATYKGKPHRDQPFLTYKHHGKGACVFINAVASNENESHLRAILTNALSAETLGWLTSP